MWETRSIERIVQQRLREQIGQAEGDSKFGLYTETRKILMEDIAKHINVTEPFLTDHGPDHIANVLDNAEKLIGKDVKDFTGLELFCLILSILFHDVGNIYSRLDHNRTAAKVMGYIWPDKEQRTNEIVILNQVVKAHCGIAGDGSTDTLKEVEKIDHYCGQQIRLREIAAIVRFADELAEGQQRTSLFMLRNNNYSLDTNIFHNYSKITNVYIDRLNQRIVLRYDFHFSEAQNKLSVERISQLKKLLEFTFRRIIKLNQERQYTKFYSSTLLPFKETSITLNFIIGDYPDTLGLPKLSLTDLIIPGDKPKDIHEYNKKYKVSNIMKKLEKQIKDG